MEQIVVELLDVQKYYENWNMLPERLHVASRKCYEFLECIVIKIKSFI